VRRSSIDELALHVPAHLDLLLAQDARRCVRRIQPRDVGVLLAGARVRGDPPLGAYAAGLHRREISSYTCCSPCSIIVFVMGRHLGGCIVSSGGSHSRASSAPAGSGAPMPATISLEGRLQVRPLRPIA
jgi:hypothetical protein